MVAQMEGELPEQNLAWLTRTWWHLQRKGNVSRLCLTRGGWGSLGIPGTRRQKETNRKKEQRHRMREGGIEGERTGPGGEGQ